MVLDRSCLVAAGPGDPGKPPAGAGSGSSPVGVEGAAGATSWARVPLAPGQLGGPPPPAGHRGRCESRGEAASTPTALTVGEAADTAAPLPPKGGQPWAWAMRCRVGGLKGWN